MISCVLCSVFCIRNLIKIFTKGDWNNHYHFHFMGVIGEKCFVIPTCSIGFNLDASRPHSEKLLRGHSLTAQQKWMGWLGFILFLRMLMCVPLSVYPHNTRCPGMLEDDIRSARTSVTDSYEL